LRGDGLRNHVAHAHHVDNGKIRTGFTCETIRILLGDAGFVFYSILHPTEGTATIYQMGDGSRLLRLASFSTSNGPDVHVYMVAADDAQDVATVQKAGYVDLLHSWQRFGPGEISRSVHMVQTIQREFRSRGAKADSHAKSIGSISIHLPQHFVDSRHFEKGTQLSTRAGVEDNGAGLREEKVSR